ncbi:flagellar basal body-associated FliL family protein [Aquisalimonas asiatica]|uniref:Flagellar protein FliL n=1 Tax=Aquisalimonas asiatica TaxID=406100 RepID=A0A1H8QT53_9GAMM|nr:flagellar basal body-associated FliL family protein [Aquisalimonas asiatica]SEO57246.1 flagellar FliL protein [Aquisalimonas asiatica]
MRVTSKAAQRGSGKLVLILLVVLIALLLAVGSAAALYLTGVISPLGNGGNDVEEVAESEAGEQRPPAPSRGQARYLEMEDAITVNISREGGRRAILQVNLQLMARDEEILDSVEEHMPLIRNNLISLFGDQQFEDITSRDGKNALREEALEEVNRVLEDEGEWPHVEAVYFTNFVTQ